MDQILSKKSIINIFFKPLSDVNLPIKNDKKIYLYTFLFEESTDEFIIKYLNESGANVKKNTFR